jgi:Polyketide cyclase / dehydrase and lipid transport
MNIRTKESVKMKNQKWSISPILVISSIVLAFATVPGLVSVGTASAEDIINASLTAHAPIDKVWNIVADIDNEPKYWSSIKEIKNLNVDKKSNVTERDVTLEFANAIAHQIVSLNPKSLIVVNQTQGPITGTRIMTLTIPDNNNNETKIDVSWNMDFSKIPIFGKGFAKDNILKTTQEALKNIASTAENTP